MKHIIELAFTIFSTVTVAGLVSVMFYALTGSLVAVALVVILPAIVFVIFAVGDYKDNVDHDKFMKANV